MCMALVALKFSEYFPLIVLHNRDEFHERQALSPSWQPTGFFSGIDVQSQGTWLGVDKSGHFAFVTNYRDPKLLKFNKNSRGELVPKYFKSHHEIDFNTHNYEHFNFMAGNSSEVSYFSSVQEKTTKLKKGIFSISNAHLDTVWPKSSRIKEIFYQKFNEKLDPILLADALFEILHDQKKPLDEELPKTGIPLEQERLVSSIFVQHEKYGTRTSTVILQDESEQLWFVAREFDHEGQIKLETKENFRVGE